jgi:hypothetical protein
MVLVASSTWILPLDITFTFLSTPGAQAAKQNMATIVQNKVHFIGLYIYKG